MHRPDSPYQGRKPLERNNFASESTKEIFWGYLSSLPPGMIQPLLSVEQTFEKGPQEEKMGPENVHETFKRA